MSTEQNYLGKNHGTRLINVFQTKKLSSVTPDFYMWTLVALKKTVAVYQDVCSYVYCLVKESFSDLVTIISRGIKELWCIIMLCWKILRQCKKQQKSHFKNILKFIIIIYINLSDAGRCKATLSDRWDVYIQNVTGERFRRRRNRWRRRRREDVDEQYVVRNWACIWQMMLKFKHFTNSI